MYGSDPSSDPSVPVNLPVIRQHEQKVQQEPFRFDPQQQQQQLQQQQQGRRIGGFQTEPLKQIQQPQQQQQQQQQQKRAYNRKETEPGLDKFLNDPQGLRERALGPLLDWALQAIPNPAARAATPVFLFATAGLRKLPVEESEWVLEEVREVLSGSGYWFKREWVRIISGVDEAVYGWIALNYVAGRFAGVESGERRRLVGGEGLLEGGAEGKGEKEGQREGERQQEEEERDANGAESEGNAGRRLLQQEGRLEGWQEGRQEGQQERKEVEEERRMKGLEEAGVVEEKEESEKREMGEEMEEKSRVQRKGEQEEEQEARGESGRDGMEGGLEGEEEEAARRRSEEEENEEVERRKRLIVSVQREVGRGGLGGLRGTGDGEEGGGLKSDGAVEEEEKEEAERGVQGDAVRGGLGGLRIDGGAEGGRGLTGDKEGKGEGGLRLGTLETGRGGGEGEEEQGRVVGRRKAQEEMEVETKQNGERDEERGEEREGGGSEAAEGEGEEAAGEVAGEQAAEKAGETAGETAEETIGTLDLGGSSLEVTFVPRVTSSLAAASTPARYLTNVSLGGRRFSLYAHSHEGYGMNDAFDRSVAYLLHEGRGEVEGGRNVGGGGGGEEDREEDGEGRGERDGEKDGGEDEGVQSGAGELGGGGERGAERLLAGSGMGSANGGMTRVAHPCLHAGYKTLHTVRRKWAAADVDRAAVDGPAGESTNQTTPGRQKNPEVEVFGQPDWAECMTLTRYVVASGMKSTAAAAAGIASRDRGSAAAAAAAAALAGNVACGTAREGADPPPCALGVHQPTFKGRFSALAGFYVVSLFFGVFHEPLPQQLQPQPQQQQQEQQEQEQDSEIKKNSAKLGLGQTLRGSMGRQRGAAGQAGQLDFFTDGQAAEPIPRGNTSAALEAILARGQAYCFRPWPEVQAKWGGLKGFEQNCFRAAYVVVLLREGLEIKDEQVDLGEGVSGQVSWTLGAALYEGVPAVAALASSSSVAAARAGMQQKKRLKRQAGRKGTWQMQTVSSTPPPAPPPPAAAAAAATAAAEAAAVAGEVGGGGVGEERP
ncbi:unnamed protein product [Closterium sp. Naga37s-1]|nr:unnamed protein product [Closterium sp. Naga37s-1]